MNVNSFGLLNSLGSILNSDQRDSDYAIALYLIPHLADVEDLSIKEIIDGAFVTRSAVRRFCNRLGFSSFSDLKQSVTSALYPSDLNGRDLGQSFSAYRHELDTSIARMFVGMSRTVTDEMVNGLAEELHAHDHVILVCASNTSGVLGRFQQELFFVGKFVELILDNYSDRPLELQGKSEPLMLLVSASGVFARSSEEWVKGIPAKKCLITANREFINCSTYNSVLCLSEDLEGHDQLGVYGKYGVSYFFDLLSACYLNRFGHPITNTK